ncbi:MFS transporter [Marinomonas sp. PE14-40]|uniref:MFS transporter n=1 Tax=Marinomonas sp. PE14-40 TaxID=3060621 RepID=UPI003F6630A7
MIQTGSKIFWRANLALLIGSFMVFANVYVTQPLLPMIASKFAISSLEANASFTITTFILGLSLLIYGPLSDALGRKWLMLVTMLGIVITTFTLAFASQYQDLLILRGVQGFFLAGLPAMAIAYLAEEYQSDAMTIAVGLYIAGNSLGGIGGRLLGGFLGEWQGLSNTFFIMAGISSICLISFAYLLPNSQHFSAKTLNIKTVLSNFKHHLANRYLLITYLIGGLSFFIFINQYSYITFVLESAPYSLSSKLIGMLFLTYLAGTCASSLSGKLALKYSQPTCMMLGTSFLILGSLITLELSLFAIIFGLTMNSFGFFLTHSTASAWVSKQANRSKVKANASASALYLTFYYMGASFGSFYLDPFWQTYGWNGVVMASLFALIVIFLLGLSLFKTRSEINPQVI